MWKQVSYQLETSVEYYTAWLEEHTSTVRPWRFELPSGELQIHQARRYVNFNDSTRRFTEVSMRASVHKTVDGEGVITTHPEYWAISFKLVPLASARIEVIARCHLKMAELLFTALLMETAERYPEAATAISYGLGIKSDNYATGPDTKITEATVNGTEQQPDAPEAGGPAIDDVLNDVTRMKQHYSGYNPTTAKRVYEAIPQGWARYSLEGGRWGPGFISEFAMLNATTVGRYLKAFRAEGLRTTEDDIEIP